MTIGVAWIRKASGGGQDLLLASDSRLSGDGNIWDDCPKLFTLPRRDAAIGFSGSTGQAYPLLLQLSNAISSHRPARDGTLEFLRLAVHLERVANSMMERLVTDPAISGAQGNSREFATNGDALVLGGYSREQGSMVIRNLKYHPNLGRWKFEHVRPAGSFGPNRTIVTFGDNKSQGRYKYLLKLLLKERGILERDMTFDFEPLEMLGRFLKMPESAADRLPMGNRPTSIGGVPQIIRILTGATATKYAVRWNDRQGAKVYLQGRLTFDYENIDAPLAVFDDDSRVRIHAPGQWPAGGSVDSTESLKAE